MPESDWNDVDCSRWRDAISALADGEQAEIDERLVTAHLAGCPACRSFQETIPSSPAIVRLSDPAGMPDLSKTISKLNAAADRAAHWSVLRIVLAVVSVQVVAFALPALILGKENGVATHSARHLGAFGVAYGVALLVVVVRPARARSILPVALVLAGAQVLGAIVDLATGKIPLVGEVRHLPQIISVFLIWFLAVPSTRRGDAVAEPTGSPRLKIVDGKRRAG
ncbi:MAG: zf-HC2 domain-containing protein [Ilumatobacteraceae bacterium]|nr:zf-HC2 domain-containing protein [Ilumatobacteraceae bacterium]